MRTAGTLLLGSLNIIGWDCWDIVSGVAAPSSSWTAGASYRLGSLIVGLAECHLRNRRTIIVGSPERRLSGSIHRTYLGLPGKIAFWNRRIIISDRLGLLDLLASLDVVITFRAAGTSYWGRRTSSSCLGLLEHHFWGRWTFLSRLGLRRNITSGVAEHHWFLRLGEHYF